MNDCGISKLDLKRRNRMQILKVVREQGSHLPCGHFGNSGDHPCGSDDHH